MGRFGFCGPTYTSQSINADDERCANLYPEVIEGTGKSQIALYPTPGMQLIHNLPFPAANGVDVMVTTTGNSPRSFLISGQGFFEITTNPTLRGTIVNPNNDPTAVSIIAAGDFVFMCAAFQSYTFQLSTNTFTNVSATIGVSVIQVEYVDGFFIALKDNSNIIFASALLDPTTWPAGSFTAVNVFPDRVVAIVENQRQLWVFGTTRSVVYYDSGNSPFPLDVIEGSTMEQGTFARRSVVRMDNSVYWLGNDERGFGVVWRANGWTPTRVSNHAVEFAIQGYSGGFSGANLPQDTMAFAYQDQGHSFYVMYFPGAGVFNKSQPTTSFPFGLSGATWVFDVATNMWHERFFLDPVTGIETAWRAKCHTFVPRLENTHKVGDWQQPRYYTISIPVFNFSTGQWLFADDFGNPIKRVRRSPVINREKEFIIHHQMEIDLETGLGPIPSLSILPFQPIADNFNRANGPLAAPWVSFFTTPQIVGNAIQTPLLNPPGTSPPNLAFAYYGGIPWPNNQFSRATVVALNTNTSTIALTTRVLKTATQIVWYQASFVANGSVSIERQKFTIATSVITSEIITIGAAAVNPGDVIELDAIENDDCSVGLNILVNGLAVLGVSDTPANGALLSGSPGFGLSSEIALGNASIDNWSGGTFTQNLDPQVMLRWSDNSGHTWQNQAFVGAGQAGKYNTRARYSRLGSSRNRVYEVSWSDPVAWRIIDAYLKATPDYQAEERLVRKLAKSA